MVLSASLPGAEIRTREAPSAAANCRRTTVTIHPRCARLIETLPRMQHDEHRPEDVLKVDCDEEGNGGDDAYDAFRYGVMEGANMYGKAKALRYA